MYTLNQLCQILIERKGSDLHLITGTPPRIRVDGSLLPLDRSALNAADIRRLVSEMLNEGGYQQVERLSDLDASFGFPDIGRFRCHVYTQRGMPAVALRAIPLTIPSVRELGLPPVIQELVRKPQGLLFITGPSGSGKSTTLAAMIDLINQERRAHIVTIEDPIEFLHSHKSCVVNQREIGRDAPDFQTALTSMLRQDPDVVCLGELRDWMAIQAGFMCAETGHLTLATLHTNSAIQTLNRLVSMCPIHQQTEVRTQLSFALEGILSQRLVPRLSGKGRALALEILVPTPAVRNLIREGKIHQIYSIMQTGQARHGMQTMNQALVDLCKEQEISPKEAKNLSSHPEEFFKLLERAGKVEKSHPSSVARLRSR
jgi:twitching motility protein PilT